MTYEIRALGTEDVKEFRRVRLDALRLHPEAFGTSYEEEAALEPTQVLERLTAPGFTRFGGFAGGTPVAGTDDATFERMLDLNLRSAFHILRAVLPVMRASGFGRIVAIGSRAAVEPQPSIAAYSASKSALVSLMRSVAMENKDTAITANVILPGTMDTPANRAADPTADFGKWIDPQQVANLALWLASDAATQITGAVIPVYGKEL